MRKFLWGLFALVLSVSVAFGANNFLVQQPNGQWAIIKSVDDGTGAQQISNGIGPSASASFGITPIASGAAAASLVLKATPGNFYGAAAVNTTGTAGYCLIINATAAPGSGSAVTPLLFAALPASGTCSITPPGGIIPAVFSTGIVFLVSSNASPYIFTSGVITAALTGMIQ